METKKIKEETIKKYLQALNTMKLLADRNAFVFTKDVTKEYKINNAFPYAARKLGYFEVNSLGYWSCKKGNFHPIDVRKILTFIYDKQSKKLKGKRNKKGQFLKGNVPHNKIRNLFNNEEIEDENISKNKIDFIDFWKLYDKKVGKKEKIKKKWDRLSLKTQKKIFDYIPKYINSQPDKQYRKNPDTFLNNQSWNDELIENKFNIENVEKNKAEFIPPTLQEVIDYCALNRLKIIPQKWYEYYKSNNWMQGENKMVNWKWSIQEWEQNQKRPIYIKSKLSEYSNEEIFREVEKRPDILTQDFRKEVFFDALNVVSIKVITDELKRRGYKGDLRIEEKYKI